MFTLLIILSVAAVWFGHRGIQRTGSYENKWGYMFLYGIPAFFIFTFLKLIL